MFRFEHIQYLWLLLALIPATLLFLLFLYWRKKGMKSFGNPNLVVQLIPDLSIHKQWIKFLLLSLAYVFIILGFANPQIGTKQEKVKRKGIDVMLAIDVSNSMLSQDVKPSRLLLAKHFIGSFIDQLRNDRLGMIVFAGRAYLQMPLTVDYSAARMYLQGINPGMVPTQGTNFADAIDMARKSFVQGETKHKALIIITDGEDNQGGVDEELEAAVKEGIKVFTIGVGTDQGGPIPFGNDFKRDEDGNIVLTKMNPAMLQDIASKGNGKYFQLSGSSTEGVIQGIFKELGGISAKQFDEMVFTDFDDQFQWCLAIAAILLLIEWWISERKFSLKFLRDVRKEE